MTALEPPTVTLSGLARALGPAGVRLQGSGEVRVGDVEQDSRRVTPGALFVARSGARAAGERFVGEAIARGAVAVLAAEGATLEAPGVPVLRARDVRLALALAAEEVHGRPTSRLRVVAVTGTNGKTTTTFLVQQALTRLGRRPARLGTLGYEQGEDRVPGSLTTPEADLLSRLAARAVRAGATHLVMEASSIGLVEGRLAGVRVDVAAFTNLTQDHLDYHGTMEAYAAAKERLFTDCAPRASVIHLGDAWGRGLAARAKGEVLRVGGDGEAELRVEGAVLGPEGVSARVVLRGGTVALQSRLVGAHNLENLAVALGVLVALGEEPGRAAALLSASDAVPGRLERCDAEGDDVIVLVDYAHTPDALARVLDALRAVTRGRIVCTFGCGGDRDPAKRPLMGAAVAARADTAIVTSDNPRSEDPAAIVDAILPGLRGGRADVLVELDRARAIERAVLGAAPGDVVLVAGKGHETTQTRGAEVLPFDDRVEARRALALRREARR